MKVLMIFIGFRYDPERVPTYTIQLEERSKRYCLLDDYYTRPPSEQQTDSREKLEGLKSEIMDVHLIRSDSHHLLASLVPSVPNITDGSQLNKVHVYTYISILNH